MNINNQRPPPAYQEYASDLLANANYKMMSLQERGLLYTLRMECWVNSQLPRKIDDLAKYLGLGINELEKSLTSKVLSFFKLQDDSLTCPELDDYKSKLIERQLKMSEGGKKGGQSTQHAHRKNKATLETALKPLSRVELSRDELSRDELGYKPPPSIKIDFNSSSKDVNEWVKQQNDYVNEVERQ